MTSPSLAQFETFLHVAETGSVTLAADALSLTKAAVSQAIKQLEQQLGLPLFTRESRRMILTTEGELLLAQCQHLKDELDATRALVSQFHQTPQGTLRVCCSPYWAKEKMVALTKTYHQHFPEVRLDFIVDERMPDMKRENIDIVFGVNWQPPDDIIARKMGETDYVLCASPAYLTQHGTPHTLAELANHTYIAHRSREKRNLIMGVNDASKLKLNVAFSCNSASLMLALAREGYGITQLHRYVVEHALAQGTLVPLLEDVVHFSTPLYIYYYKHRYLQPKVRHFIALALDA